MFTCKVYTKMLAIPVVLLLGGCFSNDINDLHKYTENVFSRPPDPIEPLPVLKLPKRVEYQGGKLGLRDPFTPFYINPVVPRKEGTWPGLTPQQIAEKTQRNPEELEQFELDSLKMVGTMNDDKQKWGLIKDPVGYVHRVKSGDYIGLNTGKIVNIEDRRIKLRELVRLDEDHWGERKASIALIE